MKHTHRLYSIFGGIVACIGAWFFLHGLLSLLGGFGLERYVMEQQGISPPSTQDMAIECLLGFIALASGLTIHYMSNKNQDKKQDKERRKESRFEIISKWVLLIILVLLVVYC